MSTKKSSPSFKKLSKARPKVNPFITMFKESVPGGVFLTVQTVSAKKPKNSAASVKASNNILRFIGNSISDPGVTILKGAKIPTFSADLKDPNSVIRKMGTKVERGRFVKGQFKPL